MIRARACAKVNLSLRVSGPGADGLHPVHGLFQSVDWYDELSLDTAEDDSAADAQGGEVIEGLGNLAWQAVVAVRDLAPSRPPLGLVLDKHIPVAAGLGGGSADAAAALALSSRLLGVDRADAAAVAADLGSDVPFCLVGGTARVAGTGGEVRPEPTPTDHALAVVVPPIEVATGAVYTEWDRLGEPEGPLVPSHELPPSLRSEELANDLQPAAISVAEEIEAWHTSLSEAWSRPVLLTGSGPTLFAFFVDREEAGDALAEIPVGARAAEAVAPVPYGWMLQEPGVLAVDSHGRVVDW